MPVLSYKERERQRREEEILAAAEQMLVERGYDDLNMDDLADAVGISKPTLYQHFKSKEDLAARVMVNALKMLEAQLHQPYEGSTIKQIEFIYRTVLQHRYKPGGVLASLGPEMVARTPNSNQAFAEHKARVMALMETMVDEAKACGEIVESIPSSVIVRSMFRLMGVLTNQEPDLDCSLNGIVHLFIYGIAPRASTNSEQL